jgi:POTRA domain, FtsQ-type
MVRTLRSPKLQKHHRQLLAVKIILAIVLAGAIIAVPVFLSRAQFLRVQTITVTGNSIIQSADIESLVRDSLAGNYWYLFPKANIALYPKDQVRKEIASKFSRIESFDIKRASLTSIAIHIVERKPESLWCEDAQENGVRCYFIDDTGLIFDEAPKFSPDVYFVYTGAVIGEPVGARYLNEESFSKLKTIIKGMQTLSLEPSVLDSISDNSYEVILKKGGSIFFSLEDDGSKILSNLESVLSDQALSVFAGGRLTVSSLDLRYGNKIIIKK